MILKVLLVVVVIAVVYFVFIKRPSIKTEEKNSTNKKDKTNLQNNDMVECAECGTYCALDDTIISKNKYYCCVECMEKN